MFEICPVCYWEDDGQELGVSEYDFGPNHTTISKYKKMYEKRKEEYANNGCTRMPMGIEMTAVVEKDTDSEEFQKFNNLLASSEDLKEKLREFFYDDYASELPNDMTPNEIFEVCNMLAFTGKNGDLEFETFLGACYLLGVGCAKNFKVYHRIIYEIYRNGEIEGQKENNNYN